MVRENCLEKEIFSRSGKSWEILWMAREIKNGLGKSGKSQVKFESKLAVAGSHQKIYLIFSRGKMMYFLRGSLNPSPSSLGTTLKGKK